MENIEYANAYSEVLEIIKYIPQEDYNKIPASKIELFQAKCNKNYKFVYNPLLTLEQQQVSKRAKAIIAILFRDYWSTDAQRNKIIKKQRNDLNKLEQQKHEKYNTKELFKNEQKQVQEENKNSDVAIVNYNVNIFKRIINKIKSILYIK